jgi:hypothetical protein
MSKGIRIEIADGMVQFSGPGAEALSPIWSILDQQKIDYYSEFSGENSFIAARYNDDMPQEQRATIDTLLTTYNYRDQLALRRITEYLSDEYHKVKDLPDIPNPLIGQKTEAGKFATSDALYVLGDEYKYERVEDFISALNRNKERVRTSPTAFPDPEWRKVAIRTYQRHLDKAKQLLDEQV